MRRDAREYGLTQQDRDWVIGKKYDEIAQNEVKAILNTAVDQSDKVLGAILFLARPGNLEDLRLCVHLANENSEVLFNAATVKDERT